MHQLRLFEMLVRRKTAVSKYYDPNFGKRQLPGHGRRGADRLWDAEPLVFVASAVPIKPAQMQVLQQINHLLGI